MAKTVSKNTFNINVIFTFVCMRSLSFLNL